MYRIERIEREIHRVRLDELERVAGLCFHVHTPHVETGAIVAHARATTPAKQIQEPGPHRGLTVPYLDGTDTSHFLVARHTILAA